MRISYTPFFHAKEGEFIALQHATKEQKAAILPLFEIGRFTDKQREQARYRNADMPICTYIHRLVDSICESVPDGPVMVDTFNWQINETTETNEAPVAYAINALLDRGKLVVPVVGLDRWESEDYRLALKSIDFNENATWVIRLDSSDIEDAADREHFLERINDVMQGLGLLSRQVGVILDFGDITGKTSEQIEAQASNVLDILGTEKFQFFSLIGCSMPPSINQAVKQVNSVGTLPRKEILAWRRLRETHHSLPLAYGDYGVRGPSSSDVENPHINGKIRYTFENAFYVARGQSVQKDDGQQMYRLAQIVASSPYYQGPSFSWGDAELYKRAIREMTVGPSKRKKLVGPGNSNKWIQFDTNHHLTWVMLEVAAVEQALATNAVEVEIVANT